jgi:transcriptional regulator with XRE-family HTH domain/antitoxin component HigA of HigAB toxin-antitoxin module
MNKFADSIGMNVGALSNIISGKRSISVKQLDKITTGMDLQEGFFYHLYITENFNQNTMDWRRLGPLLLRCAELNKVEEIKQILQLTLENLNYIPLLFDMAEHFYIKEKKEAAILLYQSIAESERNQHSERLALCQYRLFMLQLNDDMENNLLLATQFEPYVERLEEDYQLDALNHLLNINGSLSKWDTVNLNAQSLLEKASKQYKIFGNSNTGKRKSVKPLISYILYSYLVLSYVCAQKDQYEKALEYIDMYAETPWINNPNEEEIQTIEQFKDWAVANRLCYQLMAGKIEVLDDYVDYISEHEYEKFLGIYTIITAANKYKLDIDNILERFQDQFSFKQQYTKVNKIAHQVTLEQHTNLLRELGIYYLNKGHLDTGVRYIIDSLESAIKINSKDIKLKCIMAIFEISLQHECYVGNEQFKNLMSDVLEMSKKQ